MTSPIDVEGGGTSVVVDGAARPPGTPEAKALEGRSPGQLMWIRFKRDRTGVISACVVIFFFLVAAAAPLISKAYGKNPYTVYADERPDLFDSAGVPVQPNGGISGEFWFGLEPGNGYDVFTKLIYGIRTSLMISVAVTLAVVVTGILLGGRRVTRAARPTTPSAASSTSCSPSPRSCSSSPACRSWSRCS